MSKNENEEKQTYPLYIMKAARKGMGYDENDNSVDELIMSKSPSAIFDYYLLSLNIIQYGSELKNSVECIFGVSLKK